MSPVLELRAIADGGHDRGSGLRADALDLGNALTGFALTEYPIDLIVEYADPTVEITKEIVQFADSLPGQASQFILEIRQDFRDHPPGASDALAKGKTTVQQKTPDLTHDGGTMVDHPLSGAMQSLDILLLDRLLWNDCRVPTTGTFAPNEHVIRLT